MDLLRDHDFHPRENTVRVFRHPPAGVLRADDDCLVVVASYGDVACWLSCGERCRLDRSTRRRRCRWNGCRLRTFQPSDREPV